MTKSVFVDTAYLVALTNVSDRHHGEAVSLATAWAVQRTTFLTTDAVLIEYGNFFARSPLRRLAAATIARLRATPGWTAVPIARDVLARAEARYASHLDKSWSVTDCFSMEVMRRDGVRDVATTDAHFAQAGFRPLMGERAVQD